jgi:hypothetical protein
MVGVLFILEMPSFRRRDVAAPICGLCGIVKLRILETELACGRHLFPLSMGGDVFPVTGGPLLSELSSGRFISTARFALRKRLT